MLLGKDAIKARNIVHGSDDQKYNPASYDLSVGIIIPPGGIPIKDEHYSLPPHGGMAEVISQESLVVPDDILGYASIKTAVSDQGALAINIGIIDPGYKGLISTTLINFSKSELVLKKGDSFLRLTFHEVRLTPPPQSVEDVTSIDKAVVPPVTQSASDKRNDDYIRRKRLKATHHFSNTFLDLEKTAEKAADKTFEKWAKGTFVLFPILLLVFTAVTFALNFIWPRFPATVSEVDLRRAVEDVVEKRLAANRTALGATQALPAQPSPPQPTSVPVPVDAGVP